MLTDHLGNVRALITDANKNGILTADEILQKSDYYAFGREITPGLVPNPNNNYKYNKKEFQSDLGELDYGARFYDPVIGRWNVVDPLSEIGRRWSPYNYGENNPIKNVDPDGMEVLLGQGDWGGDLYTGVDAQRFVDQLKAGTSSSDKDKDKDKDNKKNNNKDNKKQTNEEKYNEKKKELDKKYPKKKDKVEEHHIDPQYLGGPKNGPTVPIPGSYHQGITNEFRNEWGYGQPPPSPEELEEIKNKVYDKYPLPPFQNQTVPAGGAPTNNGIVQKISTATGLTGTALFIYIVVSEGTRLFPPRNFVPIP